MVQKLPKILTADISEDEFNVANKLVKLDANAKILKAQIPISALDYGLAFYGEVTEIIDETHFKSDDLKDLNDNFFRYYSVYVLRDAAGGGAAPQNERQPISSYVSADGTFTHTAFTTPLEVGDEVLILHPYIGEYIAAIEAKLDDIKGATGIFYEQADVAVNINAITASETNVLNLATANTRYIVRHLRLKCADPGANQVLVRLYELINDVLTNIDMFTIDNTNFGSYFSLMDMFGLPYLAGDQLKVTVQASAGGPYAITGQYIYAKTNV